MANIFDDAKLAELANKMDDKAKQRLGEVSGRALKDKAFARLAFSPATVVDALKADSKLQDRVSGQDMGAFTPGEYAYLQLWSELAEKTFAGDDAKLLNAIKEQGDRGPSG